MQAATFVAVSGRILSLSYPGVAGQLAGSQVRLASMDKIKAKMTPSDDSMTWRDRLVGDYDWAWLCKVRACAAIAAIAALWFINRHDVCQSLRACIRSSARVSNM